MISWTDMRHPRFTGKMNRSEKSTRHSNIELLRIVSMCMIIAMHYMTKGMKIDKLSVDAGAGNIVFWIIYAFCLSSVNAYVFISGYFAPDSKWSIGRLVRLWAEVLFYSIGVATVMSAAGAYDLMSADLSVLQRIFMPVTYEHYWFACAFIMLMLFMPVLNLAITKLDKKIFSSVLVLLLIVFCGFKSIDPYLIPWDKYGNDVIWFMVLYLSAGYMRMYGIPFIAPKPDGDEEDDHADDLRKSRIMRGWIVYITFSLVTFLLALAYSVMVRRTGKLEYSMDMTYCYNYITIFIASIGLFGAFMHIDIGYRPWINRIAGYTFGVYLLHDNIALRELWMKVPGMESAMGNWWQVFHMLLCIVIIFVCGVAVDVIRDVLFGLIGRCFGKTKRADK